MYIDTITFEYPISETEIRNRFPNISFPETFVCPENYAFVFSLPQPEYNSVTQYVIESAPIFTTKGTWEQQWQIIKKYVTQTEEDTAISEHTTARINELSISVRQQRNSLLNESDWTQVLDAPVNRTAWAQYRQQLRDVTSQPGFPHEVTWPQKPE